MGVELIFFLSWTGPELTPFSKALPVPSNEVTRTVRCKDSREVGRAPYGHVEHYLALASGPRTM